MLFVRGGVVNAVTVKQQLSQMRGREPEGRSGEEMFMCVYKKIASVPS